jgi:hypothetical protein
MKKGGRAGRLGKAQVVIAALVLVYVGDYFVARVRGDPIKTVQVEEYFAIPLKNGQTQYASAGSKKVACVEALMPHIGDRPCWYVRRHRQEWIKP